MVSMWFSADMTFSCDFADFTLFVFSGVRKGQALDVLINLSKLHDFI